MCESLRSGTVISIRNARKESRHDRHLFEFIAVKRPVEFRFLEAAIRHRQWTTQTGPSCHHQIKGRYRSEAVGERADARYSLIGTARLNGLDPEPALKMLLQTLIQSQRKTRQE